VTWTTRVRASGNIDTRVFIRRKYSQSGEIWSQRTENYKRTGKIDSLQKRMHIQPAAKEATEHEESGARQ
jgi:hypothetical protein